LSNCLTRCLTRCLLSPVIRSSPNEGIRNSVCEAYLEGLAQSLSHSIYTFNRPISSYKRCVNFSSLFLPTPLLPPSTPLFRVQLPLSTARSLSDITGRSSSSRPTPSLLRLSDATSL
jgi:hypothetical protein